MPRRGSPKDTAMSKYQFTTTIWEDIRNAREGSAEQAREALEKLCRTYRFAIYAFIRRERNCTHEEAEDLTQEFFARFLEKDYLWDCDKERGRFRNFLLASVKHFLINEYHWRHAKKRWAEIVLWDDLAPHEIERYINKAKPNRTPLELFEGECAQGVLAEAYRRFCAGHTEGSDADLFNHLRPFLSPTEEQIPYRELATRLGVTENNLKQRIFRIRRDFGKALRNEVLQTVANPADVDDELRYLMAVLSRSDRPV
jgi:DNA-directed RNA polymerase specialized sigma24 family protein